VGLPAAAVAAGVAAGMWRTGYWTTGHVTLLEQRLTCLGIMAAGMVFPMALGEVDLSVGGVFAAGLIVGTFLVKAGLAPGLVALVVIGVAALFGLVNGLAVAWTRFPAALVTLATAILASGLAYALSRGRPVADALAGRGLFADLSAHLLGMPASLWVLAGAVLVLSLVAVDRVDRLGALVISAVAAGVACVISLGGVAAAAPAQGQWLAPTAIGAVLAGGVTLGRGRAGGGHVVAAVAGAVACTVVGVLPIFRWVPGGYPAVGVGVAVLVIAVAAAVIRRAREAAKR
jgi:ribose transport system permease protein